MYILRSSRIPSAGPVRSRKGKPVSASSVFESPSPRVMQETPHFGDVSPSGKENKRTVAELEMFKQSPGQGKSPALKKPKPRLPFLFCITWNAESRWFSEFGFGIIIR